MSILKRTLIFPRTLPSRITDMEQKFHHVSQKPGARGACKNSAATDPVRFAVDARVKNAFYTMQTGGVYALPKNNRGSASGAERKRVCQNI